MRVLVILAAIAVFVAMMIFDTAALIQLTAFCLIGECGVSPIWIAAGLGGIVLAAAAASRWPRKKAKRKTPRPKQPRPSTAKAAARKKAK